MITIITVGKKHEEWIRPGIERYQKRLKKPFDIEWDVLPHSSQKGDRAREEESDRLSNRLTAYDFVVLLDENGTNFDTPSVASLFDNAFTNGKKVALVIGGAYGVGSDVFERADVIWSLSRLVFPHQLVRLILTEQVYRMQEITGGRRYHHT